MVIKTIPENLWEEYSKQSSGKSKDEVETILNELFSDECNNLTEVTVRQLQGGKFGAHLFLASYTANQNTRKDWVIKFVEPKKIHLIQKERHAIEKLVNKIQPGVKIRVSVNGAIAYPFIKSEFNFDDLLLESRTDREIQEFMRSLFRLLSSWYREAKVVNTTFFDDYRFGPAVKKVLPKRIVELWRGLKKCWPITRGYATTECHGDLNPTNILLGGVYESYLINFAETGESHWTTDFTRLERQLRYLIIKLLCEELGLSKGTPEENKIWDILKKILFLPDSNYWPEKKLMKKIRLNVKNNTVLNALYAITQVRDLDHRYFGDSINDGGNNEKHLSKFEEEYFLMMAFQQVCLAASDAWTTSDKINKAIFISVKGIINYLLHRKKYIIPIFVKIKVEKEFPVAPGNVEDTEYLWVKKIPLIKKGIIKGKEVACNQENLKKYVEQDRTTCEFGLDVLECTDTIVFRENSDKDYEFLLLHRQEFKDTDKGWEYPKGGMEYHEPINELAIRELPLTHLLIFCGIRKKFHTE